MNKNVGSLFSRAVRSFTAFAAVSLPILGTGCSSVPVTRSITEAPVYMSEAEKIAKYRQDVRPLVSETLKSVLSERGIQRDAAGNVPESHRADVKLAVYDGVQAALAQEDLRMINDVSGGGVLKWLVPGAAETGSIDSRFHNEKQRNIFAEAVRQEINNQVAPDRAPLPAPSPK